MEDTPKVPPSLLTELRESVYGFNPHRTLSDPADNQAFEPCRPPFAIWKGSRWKNRPVYWGDEYPINRTAWLNRIEKRQISTILAREAWHDALVARSAFATLALSIYLNFEVAVHIAVFAFWIL